MKHIPLALLALLAPLTAQGTCSWETIPGSPVQRVLDLAVVDTGGGHKLVVAGTHNFGTSSSVASWDGSSWENTGAGLTFHNGSAKSVVGFDLGSGPALYYNHLFRLTELLAGSWSNVSPLQSGVSTLGIDRSGPFPRLIVAGTFTNISGRPASGVAAWNGRNYLRYGKGGGPVVDSCCDEVKTILSHDDGSGPALFVGGTLSQTQGVWKWDGTDWTSTGLMTFDVESLVAFDDGTGPALYAGTEGGAIAGVAKWDGTSWSAAGTVGNPNFDEVKALQVFDDGTGPALYAAGDFQSIGGVAANLIARWDGQTWSAVPGGPDSGEICSLAVYDDGSGAALYAGGRFPTIAGGTPANGIARYGCGGTISVTPHVSPGAVAFENANLIEGNEYFNFISLDPCPTTGGGPFYGLCATTPAAVRFLLSQSAMPLGSAPTHFTAPADYASWPPMPFPVSDYGSFDVLCVDVTGGSINAVSKVRNFSLPD